MPFLVPFLAPMCYITVLDALADDVPNNYRKFGLSSSDIVQIKVDGTAIFPTDTHVFNIKKMFLF